MKRSKFSVTAVAALALAGAAHATTTISYTGSVIDYTVQRSGLYNIVVFGAAGGNTQSGNRAITTKGGSGGEVGGAVRLTKGDTLAIAVGGVGNAGNIPYGGGGGGSSYVVGPSASSVLIAGGGGGSSGWNIFGSKEFYSTPGGDGGVGDSGDGGGGKDGGPNSGGGGGGLYGDGKGGQNYSSGFGGSGGIGGAGGAGVAGYAAPGFGSGGFGGGGSGAFAYGGGGGGGGGGYSGGNAGYSANSRGMTAGGGGGTSYIGGLVIQPFAVAGQPYLPNDVRKDGGNGRVTIDSFSLANPQLSTLSFNFDFSRQGTQSRSISVDITNAVTGSQTDTLVTKSTGFLPQGISIYTPEPLVAGARSKAYFTANTAVAGTFSETGYIDFVSHDDQLADVALASQRVIFRRIVTQIAVAGLFKSAGAGVFSGASNAYSLDFGSLPRNSGTIFSALGVRNLIALSSFSEAMGGEFTKLGSGGFSLLSNSFSGLRGGQSDTNNWLSFDTTGLRSGRYTETFIFRGYSAALDIPSFGNAQLAPITLNVTALVTSGVPEPKAWALMIIGFGGLGARMRGCRRSGKLSVALI